MPKKPKSSEALAKEEKSQKKTKSETGLEKLKTEFLEHLEIELNRSQLTIRNYELYLGRFLEFAQKHGAGSPDDIDIELVRQYRLWLNRFQDEQGRDLKLITQNYHIIALRSFLKYLAKRDIKSLAAEKIELPKTPSRQVEFLEGGDLERLLEAPKKYLADKKEADRTDELSMLRDRAILETLFSTGLRVGELEKLTAEKVNLKKDEFAIKGKGGKIRTVFLSDSAKQALGEYRKARTDNSPALFVSHNRHSKDITDFSPLSARSIQRVVKKYAKLAGLSPDISPHTLRHSLATDLLQAGADLRSVQEILGHSSITTTQIYTHITNKRLKEVHKRFHAKSRGK